MSNVKCTNCGADNKSNIRYCTNCGHELLKVKQESSFISEAEQSTKSTIIIKPNDDRKKKIARLVSVIAGIMLFISHIGVFSNYFSNLRLIKF